MQGARRAAAGLLFFLLVFAGCHDRPRGGASDVRPDGPVRLVFKLQPLWGAPAPFRALIDDFERQHPGVEIATEYLPNASDLAHQTYLTSLEGGAQDFDVMVIDVIWAPEFARAGWAADLSEFFPPAQLKQDFLPGPAEAVVVDGRTVAVPWYVDVGLLYYRTDLVPRAPKTYAELQGFARAAQAKDPSLAGYVWQGKQYEGLNCNVLEAVWGHGGAILQQGRLTLDTAPARDALSYLRGLIASGISPPSVTSAAEEEARRTFGSGHAVFMRNWPYAWAESQKPDSPIRGKVGFAPLPTLTGEPGSGTLGGWQLAVNANIPRWRQELAASFIRHLTSPQALLVLAQHYARNPPRRSVYESPELKEAAPFIASLLPVVEHARPRPVSAWYMLLTDTLQGEFSAAIAGLRPPDVALARAQKLADHLTGAAK
jgi:multiple sugar transport system substrate-binding protein